MKILVTGASGFIGRSLLLRIPKDWEIVAAYLSDASFLDFIEERDLNHVTPLRIDLSDVGSLTQVTDFFKSYDACVYLAANGDPAYSEKAPIEDLKSNTCALLNTVQSWTFGNFLYFSSGAVYDGLRGDVNPQSALAPCLPYGISKWEAEQNLLDIAKTTKMEIVILRAPLVYGPGVKGNFYSLLKLVKSGIVLPFGSIKNNRSLLFVGNFADAITTAANHPNAGNKTFFVSDDNNISTPELVDKITLAMGKKSRIFKLPIRLLKIIGFFIGRSAAIRRLTGSLTVDINHIKTHLSWHPPFSIEDGLKETADWFVRNFSK